jgi:protein-S-isoprenylcysteine O-methyltransferase Ste14
VNPIVLRVRKRGLLGLAELTMFGTVSVWAVVVVWRVIAPGSLAGRWFLGAPLVDSAVTRYAGLGLVSAAFVALIAAQAALGKAWRLGIDEEHPGELVTGGIYALTRNPIYLFFDLYFVGTFLINGTWFFALSAAFTIVNLHYQILREEQWLAELHKTRYEQYCLRVPRYLRKLPGRRLASGTGKVDAG